jgi:folate-binding protein YgfZ
MTEASPGVLTSSLEPADYAALEAARHGAALVEFGRLPTFTVTGPDRVSWLNGLVTCDVRSVDSNRGNWGLFLDRLGKIQAVVSLLGNSETLYLGLLWGDAEAVGRELDARLIMEDAELTLGEAHWRLWLGSSLPATSEHAQARGLITFSGEGVLEVFEGAPPSAEGSQVLSAAAWDVWRVQHGLPWGGIDFTSSARPHEASLERRAVSWSKGCYLGQEVVCMQDMRGKVKRSVRALTATAGPLEGSVGSDVYEAGKKVGQITTAVYDTREGRWWLLGEVVLSALPSAPGKTALVWVRSPSDELPLETLETKVAARA